MSADEWMDKLRVSLGWHFRCHAEEPEKSYASLGIANAETIVARMLADARADGWDERDRARATYPDPHPEDCAGWEDCWCATYPNPYRAAHPSDTERAGDAE